MFKVYIYKVNLVVFKEISPCYFTRSLKAVWNLTVCMCGKFWSRLKERWGASGATLSRMLLLQYAYTLKPEDPS